jgi:hypothetical protein
MCYDTKSDVCYQLWFLDNYVYLEIEIKVLQQKPLLNKPPTFTTQ